MRATGPTPRLGILQGQGVLTAVDLGFSSQTYTAAGQDGNVISIAGFGAWSLYITTTDPGQSTLSIVVRDDLNSSDLAVLQVSALVTTGATRHFFVGPAGSTVAFVADLVKLRMVASAGTQTATIRAFGRGF